MQTHTDYESMFKAVSMRGAGHFVGGILGKFVKLNVFLYIKWKTCIA